MPPDLVYVAQNDPAQYRPGISRGIRNGSRDDGGEGSHSREIELKRSRGEISCAECRRLKIKCDKRLPCSSCLRRGCASLCPNGSLATGQGTRFVLAATDHLHKRISKMTERIRQLEDALAIMHGDSDEPHPLLRDELLNLKVDKGEDKRDDVNEVPSGIDALGTLSINDRGNVHFFGSSGGSELLLLNDDDMYNHSPNLIAASPLSAQSSIRDSKSPISPEIALFANAFPFTPSSSLHDMQQKIESYLPPWEDAVKLAEIYLEQAAWLFRSLTRSQLMEEMLPAIYHQSPPKSIDEKHADLTDFNVVRLQECRGPHSLSLLFMAFAVGTLVDLNAEPFSAEADHYYQLARAALTLQSVFEQPNLFTIQVLHLMSIYNGMRQPSANAKEDNNETTSMEMSWSLIRLCHQLAQTIGLHRDSARWGLRSQEVERRRNLFWDLYVADTWQSLSTGRPPSITLPYIDCQFPIDEDAHINEQGKTEPGFGSWLLHFTKECIGPLTARILTATVPPYPTILELDAKIRDFPLPSFPSHIPLDPSRPALVMARFVLSHAREVTLLFLHRSFFAQAMVDDPMNPLRSQYAPSFLATYRSAMHVLKSIREEFEIVPALCARFWMPWTYAFSSAVVFGSIVTRGPGSSMAPSSLQELDMACQLFMSASKHSRRAAKASAILQKLKLKAHAAYDACLRSKGSPSTECILGVNPKLEKDDELDLISGRVRLISSRKSNSGSNSSRETTSPSRRNMAFSKHTPSPPISQNQPILSASSDDSLGTDLRVATVQMVASQNVSSVRSHQQASPTDLRFPSGWDGVGSETREDYKMIYPGNLPDSSVGIGNEVYGSATGVRGSYPVVKYDDWGDEETTTRYSNTHSHSSHPEINRMDGMEYGRQQHGFVSQHNHREPHLHPSQVHSQTHMHPHIQTSLPPLSPNSQPIGNYSGTSPLSATIPNQHNVLYHQLSGGGNTPPELYATAPRELSEMGLASHQSGINQRWTSYLQDSGLFYSGNSM